MPFDYFLDFNRGDDNNDGLSKEKAWRNVSKIAQVVNAAGGDAFHVEAESIYQLTPLQRIVPPATWKGTQGSAVVIDGYSYSSQNTRQRPLFIMHAETVPADWTYDPALNGWRYLYPTAHINNAVLIRLADSWLASATDNNSDTAVESVDGRYKARMDSQTVVLYAPSNINPVNYYGKVVVGAQAAGAISVSSGRGAVTVRGLEFFETGCGVSQFSNNSLECILVVEDCKMRRGCLVTIVGAVGGNLQCWARGNEVEDFGAIGMHANSTGGAGISYVEFSNNRIHDGVHQWAQAGIYLQARNAGRDTVCVVRGNEVSGCRWGTRDKLYDGCGIYIETGSDGCLVTGNVVHDCFVALQDNSGRRNYVTGNVIYNCRRGIRVTDESNNQNGELFLDNNTFIVGDLDQRSTEFGNSTQGADYPAVWSLSGDDAIKINARNNIFCNSGGQRGRAVFGLAQIATTYDLRNNWVFGFETDVLNGANNNVLASPPTVTHAGTTDPRPFLNADYSLKDMSIGFEGFRNPLANAGTPVEKARCFNGAPQVGSFPVGAFMSVVREGRPGFTSPL